MKKVLNVLTIIFAVIGVVGLTWLLFRFHWNECKKVGHSTLYCLISK